MRIVFHYQESLGLWVIIMGYFIPPFAVGLDQREVQLKMIKFSLDILQVINHI